MLRQESLIDLCDVFPSLRSVDAVEGVEVIRGGKRYTHFCGEDYLGLAQDRRLRRAAIEGMSLEGCGATTSPDGAGYKTSHLRLSKSLAAFMHTEDAVIFPSRGQALAALLSLLIHTGDQLFVDSLCPRSTLEITRQLPCSVQTYAHADVKELERLLLNSTRGGKRYLITETVFSQNGDLAPLLALSELASAQNMEVILDETHALGVYGVVGSGVVEHLNLLEKGMTVICSFHAAMGSFGAAVCMGAERCRAVRQYSSYFAEEPLLPPASVYAATRGLELLQIENKKRAILKANCLKLKAGLDSMGLNVQGHADAPLKLITLEKPGEVIQGLFERNILVLPIFGYRPQGELLGLRMSVSALHTDEHLNMLLQSLEDVSKRIGLL